jgi:hypothetical protein
VREVRRAPWKHMDMTASTHAVQPRDGSDAFNGTPRTQYRPRWAMEVGALAGGKERAIRRHADRNLVEKCENR